MNIGPRRSAWNVALLGVLGLVAAMAVVATAGFRSVFPDWSFLVVSAIAALAAAAIVAGAGRLQLLVGEAVAASAIGFLLVGMAVCGGPRGLFSGLVHAWADVLSGAAPLDLTASLRVVPFTLAWFGVALGGELARHSRQPALPTLGPLVTLGVSALLSSPDRGLALVQGALVAAGALAVTALQQRTLRGAGRADGQRRLLAAGRAAAMLTVVAVAAPFVGQQLPLADAHDRYDLRDQIDPPWDPLAVPSPLVQLKASLQETRADDVVFTARSDTPVTRWQVAVLGDYDGIVWTVGTEASSAADEFRSVGTHLPAPPADSVDPDADEVTATITAVDLDGPWMPTPGWPEEVQFAGETPADVRQNLRTGTLALTSGLPAGTTYEVQARLPSTATEGELATRRVEILPETDDLDLLPPAVRNLAADIVEGIDPGWEQLAAVRDTFRSTGFYDSTPATPPGHSYFRLAELLADPDRIVGYEEQYAAAAGVIARAARLPARVVVGYLIDADRYQDGTAEVRAGDISAWVEVQVDGAGWVPIDVTPDRSRVPTTDQQGTSFEDIAVPNPPPPPQPPPDVQVVADDEEPEVDEPEDDEDDDEQVAAAGSGWVRPVVIGASIGAGLLLALLALIVGLKARRTKRRRRAARPATRIAGAWNEVRERYEEAKVAAPSSATPLEAARSYLDREPSAAGVQDELFGLVAVVDRAAYDADEPDNGDADTAWQYSRTVVGALDAGRSPLQRLAMRLDPRPLLRRRGPSARSAG